MSEGSGTQAKLFFFRQHARIIWPGQIKHGGGGGGAYSRKSKPIHAVHSRSFIICFYRQVILWLRLTRCQLILGMPRKLFATKLAAWDYLESKTLVLYSKGLSKLFIFLTMVENYSKSFYFYFWYLWIVSCHLCESMMVLAYLAIAVFSEFIGPLGWYERTLIYTFGSWSSECSVHYVTVDLSAAGSLR